MNKATIIRSVTFLVGILFVVGFSSDLKAQTKASFDGEFVFFLNGANVKIPTLDGSVVADPINPTSSNKVFRINYGGWAESGFRWPNGDRETFGVDASSVVGENYGESDTLFFSMLSDTANAANGRTGGIFVAFLDSDTGLEYGVDNLPFRCRWTIPDWAHDGEWHEFALPLPPRTNAALDSAKAGKNLDGTDLEVEVDSLFDNWIYGGAWANGVGVFEQTDDEWEEFDWESVKYFGVHYDFDANTFGGGGPIFFDDFYIGTSETNTEDAPPAAVASVDIQNADGINTLSWGSVSEAGGYNIYFSESEITNVLADGVVKIGSRAFDGELTIDHTVEAPFSTMAQDFDAYYAVTAVSSFGSESNSASAMISSDIKSNPSYAYGFSGEDIDNILVAVADEEIPDAATMAGMFPDGYEPFAINQERMFIENGAGPDDDTDLSGKFWIGFGSDGNELIIYSEITDDVVVPPPSSVTTSNAWAYDSWEMGLGNYSPASFIIGSTHGEMSRGDDPDYQFRAGLYADRIPFIHDSYQLDGEIPNSQTIGEETDYGYRLLTFINTISLSGTSTLNPDDPDEAFDFPGENEIATYPFNVALNDADVTGETPRDTQVSWSNKAGGDGWYNQPVKWQVIAFVGNGVAVSNEYEDGSATTPERFSLEQNYPNPFNPTTKINFSLESATDVSLEVFNMLGQKVVTLISNESMSAGKHSMTFDASNLSSGLYLYRIRTSSSFVQSKKMMLIK